MRTKEEEARYQLALKSHKSSPVKTLSKTLLVPAGNTLSFKKKENSTSGDDKAIERKAIDWLNAHLASQQIVVDDIVKGLGDGLYLIYALEVIEIFNLGCYRSKCWKIQQKSKDGSSQIGQLRCGFIILSEARRQHSSCNTARYVFALI